jgi:hypothetical protein
MQQLDGKTGKIIVAVKKCSLNDKPLLIKDNETIKITNSNTVIVCGSK